MEQRLDNVHQLTREVSLWCEYYRKWSAAHPDDEKYRKSFELLDRVTQQLVEVFGDPSDHDE